MTWLALCVLLLPLAACVGTPTGESSWRESADVAIGGAISGLGTARLVLESDERDGISHSYAVVTLTDVVESTEKETARFALLQPPDDLHDLSADVVRALSQATRTLVRIRTAFASAAPDHYLVSSLLRLARAELKHLEKLQKSIR